MNNTVMEMNAAQAIFLYCCLDCPSCPAHAIQRGRTTWAILDAMNKCTPTNFFFIPLSHYSKNVIRTYYAHEMLKFVVKSAGNFSFS